MATRPILIQLEVLLAGLKVLDAYTKWVADATGEDAAGPLQNTMVQDTMTLAMVIIGLLLLYFSEKSKSQ